MSESHLDIRAVIPSPSGEYDIDRSKNDLIRCTDRILSMPKNLTPKCPFITAPSGDDELSQCEYSAAVLENLVRWVEHYDVKGVAASPMTRPCLYRDFSYVLTDTWDNSYYHSRLCGPLNQRHYLATMSAAEKYEMDGLLDFLAVGLGCKLRNEEDSTIIHDIMGLDKDAEITEEDLAKVSADYAWFDELTKPVDAQ